MFGFATRETPEYLPLALAASHAMMRTLNTWVVNSDSGSFGPDGKCQVTVTYENGQPTITGVVVSVQHRSNMTEFAIETFVKTQLMSETNFDYPVSDDCEYWINPTGRFVIGGPHADAGLTGRKIIVDTYGGMGRHGGGAFSGKDPSKVDRSAAYAARQVAKAIITADERIATAEVQLAYAIGVEQPVSVSLDIVPAVDMSSELVSYTNESFCNRILNNVDLTPDGIIKRLGLREFTRYQETARFGHFTDSSYPWEDEQGLKEIQELIFG